MNKVFILGGGVAGLTAAHELAEREFDVTVFERNAICGGKARSMDYEGSGTGGRKNLPGEHGFRFFPGFYWHTTDTMSRIWYDQANNKRVVKNLVPGEKIGIAQKGKPLYRLEANPPGNLLEWVEALTQMFANPSLGVPRDEAIVFVKKLLCFLGSGPTRRVQSYEGKTWWEYTEAATKSTAYQNILARGLSRSLVAMRPDKASTLTVASMLVQILVNIIDPPGPGSDADRVLNAPTSEAWIEPWVKQLQTSTPPVKVLMKHIAKELTFDAAKKKITTVKVASATGEQWVGDEFDYYIAAVPVEVVKDDQTLFPPALKSAAGLVWNSPMGIPMGVDQLQTDWMTGVLFYLNRTAPALRGHIVHVTSPWALTSITQGQFWTGYPWAQRGDGQTRDILSAIISDWDTKAPRLNETAKGCTEPQIFAEAWEQLKEHLANELPPGKISDADRINQFLDPAIVIDTVSGKVVTNTEQLLVNLANSRQHRPPAKTALTNFFVAADYVKTITDLACMEAANEAARHATNALLAAAGSTAPRCTITPLKEPDVFAYFRDRDEGDYLENPAGSPFLCQIVGQLMLDPSTLTPSLAPPAPSPPSWPSTVPAWVWMLVLLGVLNAALLLIVLYLLAGN